MFRTASSAATCAPIRTATRTLHIRPAPTLGAAGLALAVACAPADGPAGASPGGSSPADEDRAVRLPAPDHTLPAERTHARFSRAIPPVLRVRPGAVVELFTREASDGQLRPGSTVEDLGTLDFDPIHPLTGPIHVEGAEPGDVLAVELLEVEAGDWGWSAVIPGFGFLAEDFREPFLRTFRIRPGDSVVRYAPGIDLPIRPFPGVIGVAPDTDSLLSTIPPRANGGNLDDRDLVAGTTVYLPVLVEGALLSLGDGHVAQGDGEVGGTAVEAPLRILLRVDLVREPAASLPSPQYTDGSFYAVTGFGETIGDAARMATRAMVDYLASVHGLGRTEAYVLTSLAAHLKIAEAVDVPHMLVTMRIPGRVLPGPVRPGWPGGDGAASPRPGGGTAR